jgi:hypothetical protein
MRQNFQDAKARRPRALFQPIVLTMKNQTRAKGRQGIHFRASLGKDPSYIIGASKTAFGQGLGADC